MKHEKTILTAFFILLQLCNGLSAQATVEDEGEAKWQSHFPEYPELYVPRPFPEPSQSIGLMTIPPDSQLVSYDALTGEEVVWEISPEDMPFEAWTEGSGGTGVETLGQGMSLLNFTGLSRISNPEAYPWRVNCKLFFKQGDSSYVGSGVLIDPLHVLTAGHCVHEGNGGNWSTDMVVVPAYENGRRPYGDALGVSYLSWTGWTRSGNRDGDIGIIELDRPIGILTGWYGCGYSDDPSFYTDITFNNASYPAEVPYDGKYMYHWSGSFDFTDHDAFSGIWTGNQVGFHRRSYSGQGGSGIYARTNSNRYAIAVVSHGFARETYCTRINSTILPGIAQFISSNTPSNLDLVALDANISQQSVARGNRLSSMSYVVHNYSSDSWTGTVNANVYLSTNENISTLDTLIGSHSFWCSFSPKSMARVEVQTPVVVPVGTAAGNYWIGVILDISDNNTDNNDTDGQEAAPLVVGNY